MIEEPAKSGPAAAAPGEPPAEGNGADEQATRIAVAAARAQAAARSRLRGPEPDREAPLRYVGLITRAIAFSIDAALIFAVAGLVWVATVLTLNLLHLPSGWEAAVYALEAIAFFLWSTGYFVTFWATTGQTPGNRLLQFRVVQEPSHQAGLPPPPGDRAARGPLSRRRPARGRPLARPRERPAARAPGHPGPDRGDRGPGPVGRRPPAHRGRRGRSQALTGRRSRPRCRRR